MASNLSDSSKELIQAVEFFSAIVNMGSFQTYSAQIHISDSSHLKMFKAQNSLSVYNKILSGRPYPVVSLFSKQVTKVINSAVSENWIYGFSVQVPRQRQSFSFRLSAAILDCKNSYRTDSTAGFAYTWTINGPRIYLQNTRNPNHSEIFEIIFDEQERPKGYIRRLFLGNNLYCFSNQHLRS